MNIQLYHLDKCGFYLRGNYVFGSLSDWWHDFIKWANGRPNIVATTTFDDPEKVPRRVYCAGTTELFEDGFGVILWNESPAHDEGIAYIDATSTLRDVKADTEALPTNSIPGWPSYIWFQPHHNMIVTLVPNIMRGLRSDGIPHARRYFQAYLQQFSRYVVVAERTDLTTESTSTIIGWRNHATHRPNPTVKSRFETVPVYLHTELDAIRARWDQIRKLITTTELRRNLPEHRSFFQSLWNVISFDSNHAPPAAETQRFKVELEWTPKSIEELDWIIGRRIDDNRNQTGIQFHGEHTTHWFKMTRAKDILELPRQLERQTIWTPEQLVTAWQKAKPVVDNILKQL